MPITTKQPFAITTHITVNVSEYLFFTEAKSLTIPPKGEVFLLNLMKDLKRINV